MALRHPGLRQREGREHAEGVQRDHRGDARAEHDDDDARGGGQRDDAVREHEPVPALGELPGHEGVARVEARQAREVGERGVRGEDQDQRRADLQDQEERAPDRRRCRRRPARSSRAPTCSRLRPAHLEPRREERHGEEARAEARPHPHERDLRVPPFGLAERRHAVRDRLDAGDRRAARRERPEHDERRTRRGPEREAAGGLLRVDGERLEVPGQRPGRCRPTHVTPRLTMNR